MQVAGFAVALRAKGEAPDEIDRPRPTPCSSWRRGSPSRARRSTPAAPAATGRTPSTSRRCRRWWWPAPAHASSSTATARRPRRAGRPTCSRSSASSSTSTRRRPPSAWTPPASRSASRRGSTRRCGTRPSRAASSAYPPSSTSSGRWPTRRSRPPRPWAAPTRGWRGHGPGARRPRRSALVFRGDDGLDELTPTTTSQVWVVRDGAVSASRCSPEDVGHRRAEAGSLRGGDRGHNAEAARRFLAGETGPVRDAVLLNAAAALVALDPDAPPGSLERGAARRARRGPRSRRQRLGRPRPGGWVDDQPGARRRPALTGRPAGLVGAFGPEGERRVQVVLGVGAEGDVRLGGLTPSTLLSRSAMTSASASCSRTRTIAMRSASPVTE